MKRLLSTLILALALASGASGQCSHSYFTSLGVETLDADYTIWYSQGHLSHAQRVAEDLAGMRDFIQTTYGVDPDFWIALLDEEDWNTLKATRPSCALPDFPSNALRLDVVVLPTPVDRNGGYEYCTRMLDEFSPPEVEAFAQATGAYPDVACYSYASTNWMGLFGIQLAYRYFDEYYQEDLSWPNYVNAFIFASNIKSSLMPEAARIDSAASATFRHRMLGRYGIPDVITFERNAGAWLQNDLDQFVYYVNWLTELGYGRNAKFPDFLGTFREILVSEGLPAFSGIDATSLDWTTLYEEAEEGLESILLESEDGPAELPVSVVLESAYPNPFNPSTTVVYSLPAAASVTISLHDVTGRAVRQIDLGFQPAGRHRQMFDADGLASGVYLLRLEAGSEVRTRAVTLVR